MILSVGRLDSNICTCTMITIVQQFCHLSTAETSEIFAERNVGHGRKRGKLVGIEISTRLLTQVSVKTLPNGYGSNFFVFFNHSFYFPTYYCANPKTVNTRIIFGILLCCEEKANQMPDGKTARCNSN